MNYLIFGVNGMAGHMIASYLIEKGHTVVGFAKEESPICKTIIGDALRQDEVKEALNAMEFDIVINCIGTLNSAVNNNKATGIYLNSVFPHYLAECTGQKQTKVIHISTDCVFEGTQGNYTEFSNTDATSLYGKSKALGELNDQKNLTIRTSIIGPELKTNGIGLFHWFMSQEGIVKGYSRVIWSGITTLQLAKIIETVSKEELTGLYHLVNNTAISKYELLQIFNTYCKDGTTKIQEDDSVRSDKSLVNTRTDISLCIPSYEEMVKEMSVWMQAHTMLYQQYMR